MQLDEYQKHAQKTAFLPHIGQNAEGKNHIYLALGLAGEVGEVANKVKKIARDHEGLLPLGAQEELGKELGDVLWYVSSLATELGLSLDAVAEENIAKLASRKERGVLQGSGDNR